MNFESLIIINSKDRVYGSESDFTYSIKNFGIDKIKGYRVNKINVPFSFYNIRNHYFTFSVNGTDHLLLFPEGNYNPDTLKQQLGLLLNPIIATTIEFNTITSKYTFTVASPNTIQFKFLSFNNYSIQRAIGFDLLSAVGNTLTSQYVVNMNCSANLNIYSQSLGNAYPSVFNTERDFIIQSIPINVNSYSYIIWQNDLETTFKLQNSYVGSIDLKLLDDYGQLINLNGNDWSIELQFYS